jgi:hypothetical protein
LAVLSPRLIQPVNLGLRGFILSEVRKRGEVLEREKHPNEVRYGPLTDVTKDFYNSIRHVLIYWETLAPYLQRDFNNPQNAVYPPYSDQNANV